MGFQRMSWCSLKILWCWSPWFLDEWSFSPITGRESRGRIHLWWGYPGEPRKSYRFRARSILLVCEKVFNHAFEKFSNPWRNRMVVCGEFHMSHSRFSLSFQRHRYITDGRYGTLCQHWLVQLGHKGGLRRPLIFPWSGPHRPGQVEIRVLRTVEGWGVEEESTCLWSVQGLLLHHLRIPFLGVKCNLPLLFFWNYHVKPFEGGSLPLRRW